MKIGKLLTVTALATGITLGAFIDSAEAIRRRGGSNSNISFFEFTIDDSVTDPFASSTSASYSNAVSDISFALLNNFLQSEERREEFPGDEFSITNAIDDFDRITDIDVSIRENVRLNQGGLNSIVDILDLDIPLYNISSDTIKFPTIRFTEADNGTDKLPDNTRIEFDEDTNQNFAIFTDGIDIDLLLRYQLSDPNQVNVTSLPNIINFIDGRTPLEDFDFTGNILTSNSSRIRYSSTTDSDDIQAFLTDIIGYQPDLLSPDVLADGFSFEVVSEPEAVPENSSIFTMFALGIIGVSFLRIKSITN